MLTPALSHLFSRFALNRLKERTVRVERKNVRTPGNEMPVSIHHQYYLGECPATRYYRGLERRADFIMVSGEREPSNGMWNGRLVGWLVGRLPAWLAWLAGSLAGWLGPWKPSVESIAGACRLSRVLRINERPHAGETRCLRTRHTRAHERTHAHTLTRATYAFRSVLYKRNIFWETFWRICGWTLPVCFPVAPMVEFSLQWCGYCPCIVRHSSVRVECRFHVRANIWHEVLRLREARRGVSATGSTLRNTCFGVIIG